MEKSKYDIITEGESAKIWTNILNFKSYVRGFKPVSDIHRIFHTEVFPIDEHMNIYLSLRMYYFNKTKIIFINVIPEYDGIIVDYHYRMYNCKIDNPLVIIEHKIYEMFRAVKKDYLDNGVPDYKKYLTVYNLDYNLSIPRITQYEASILNHKLKITINDFEEIKLSYNDTPLNTIKRSAFLCTMKLIDYYNFIILLEEYNKIKDYKSIKSIIELMTTRFNSNDLIYTEEEISSKYYPLSYTAYSIALKEIKEKLSLLSKDFYSKIHITNKEVVIDNSLFKAKCDMFKDKMVIETILDTFYYDNTDNDNKKEYCDMVFFSPLCNITINANLEAGEVSISKVGIDRKKFKVDNDILCNFIFVLKGLMNFFRQLDPFYIDFEYQILCDLFNEILEIK